MTAPVPGSLTDSLLEHIARAIHERYRRNQHDRKPGTDPAMLPWAELSEPLKRSNRDQAADIGVKLNAVGCSIGPLATGREPATFTAEEVERLAILEHERWVAERRRAGWTPGNTRDVERKVTPYLVPWAELSEEIREYDREAVRAIPGVLAEAGLGMFRSGGSG